MTRRRFIEVFGGCLPARHGRDRTDKPRRQRWPQSGSSVSLCISPRARFETKRGPRVRHHRLRRSRPGNPSSSRVSTARVSRLRLGRHRPRRGRRLEVVRTVGNLDALRAATGNSPSPASSGSATRAGPPTGGLTRRTRIRTRLHRAHRGRDQRHHRELHGAARRAESRRRVFTSETDTEMLAHLIEEHYQRRPGRRGAGRSADSPALRLRAVSADEPVRLVGTRSDSPLVIGLGEGETFIASAIPAFLAQTRGSWSSTTVRSSSLTAEGVNVRDADGAPGRAR